MRKSDQRPAKSIETAVGARHGPFVVFEDLDGSRHAVRLSSVVAVSDLDQTQDATLLQLPGGRAIVVRSPFPDVLEWFLDATAAPPARMTMEAARTALSLANMRPVVSCVLQLLIDEGIVPAANVEVMRSRFLAEADGLAQKADPLQQACRVAAQDVQPLFDTAVPDGSGARG